MHKRRDITEQNLHFNMQTLRIEEKPCKYLGDVVTAAETTAILDVSGTCVWQKKKNFTTRCQSRSPPAGHPSYKRALEGCFSEHLDWHRRFSIYRSAGWLL